ncbi:MAG: sigma 54-interacting transcriptional regulator [Desulfovibrio sp.]|uniref:sigma 54-interacting transcriptional regulator n=1 Tax=Desulfovibrio sp. TaxID=885 RepID=UPI001A66D401|nr:sigma 54-interacting transcriptional regulator [Desulfovibrio sp.]MBD5417286.1 sigma 54-interacting transcriptional regulator [Desulfovibrio sp.]
MTANANLEARLHAVLDQLPGGVCAPGWRLLYANAGLRALLGIGAKLTGATDAAGSPPAEALATWLGQGALEGFDGHGDAREDAKQRGRLLFRHGGGSTYLLHWWEAGAPDEAGSEEGNGEADTGDGSGGSHAALRCFTVQELPPGGLEQAASHSLRELDNVLESIHDGIWVIDGQGVTRRINRAMERIAGIRACEVVGRHVSEPLREGRFKTCVTLRALETRHTVTLFDDYSNGKRCLNTSTPIFDADGKVWRVIAAIRDITELENLQTKLSNLEVEALAYRLRAQGLEGETASGLLGQSLLVQRVRQDIAKAAQAEAVTLILGETGTGKSLAAKLIHDMSARADKPFVAVNCGAIPPALMESEIFGYEGGAFTGAARGGKRGMLELAQGGTLLLDEIGELSLPMQAKLLHVLDGQPIYRVGGTQPITADARLIAATNKPLDRMVAEGRFREDLFYRLRVLCVEMPPLRERRDDILLLAWHFLRKIGQETGTTKRLDPRTEQIFLAYGWPGNVRELQSVIQSLLTLCERQNILPGDLPSYMREAAEELPEPAAPRESMTSAVERLERDMLSSALAETGSTYKAARRLGISQSSVVRKAKKYGLHTAGAPGWTERIAAAPGREK